MPAQVPAAWIRLISVFITVDYMKSKLTADAAHLSQIIDLNQHYFDFIYHL
jgi:hypothetical protein